MNACWFKQLEPHALILDILQSAMESLLDTGQLQKKKSMRVLIAPKGLKSNISTSLGQSTNHLNFNKSVIEVCTGRKQISVQTHQLHLLDNTLFTIHTAVQSRKAWTSWLPKHEHKQLLCSG